MIFPDCISEKLGLQTRLGYELRPKISRIQKKTLVQFLCNVKPEKMMHTSLLSCTKPR